MTSKEQTSDNPKFWQTLRKDLRQTEFQQTFRQDYRKIKEFYLTSEQKKKLTGMNIFRRFFYISWWLLKGMFFKLTPLRRILFLVGMILILGAPQVEFTENKLNVDMNTTRLGGVMIFWVLLLELKDKLIAKHELDAGHAVQRELSPPASPEIPGWDLWLYSEPANEVGGDLVDILPLREKRYALSLGDVAGKGLGAALLMVKLQATIRALAPETDSPAALAEKLNAIFRRDSLPNRFASLIYLQIHSDENSIQLINAGHLQPLLMKNGKTEELPKGNPALGLSGNVHFDLHERTMSPGDLLLIFSDGVTDATNERGEFWGEQRVRDFLLRNCNLSSGDFGLRLVQTIGAFQGDTPANDDLSLIVIKKES